VPFASPQIPADQPLLLTVDVVGTYDWYFWTVHPPVLDLNNTALFPLVPEQTGILIPAHSLLPGIIYTFSVHVINYQILSAIPTAFAGGTVCARRCPTISRPCPRC
jgi:hypothetical protein